MKLNELNILINNENKFINDIKYQLSKVIVGQEDIINKVIIAILSDGHVLLEGVPGLAKTLLLKSIANLFNASFQRIQFTPDLLPADLTGTMIYDHNNGRFTTKKGPIFANFVLADEINRAPAKVQSALLEAMQERQVTIGDFTYQLPEPFFVMATQNPIEQEGTYKLPEAQLDRFLFLIKISYPTKEQEKIILKNYSSNFSPIFDIKIDLKNIMYAKKIIREIYLDPKIEDFIVDIVEATRYPEKYDLVDLKKYIEYGVSPRASINLALSSKAVAFINSRGYVIPEDIIYIYKEIMSHRIGLSYEADLDNVSADDIISRILRKVYVP